jgi:hypothetical protein
VLGRGAIQRFNRNSKDGGLMKLIELALFDGSKVQINMDQVVSFRPPSGDMPSSKGCVITMSSGFSFHVDSTAKEIVKMLQKKDDK